MSLVEVTIILAVLALLTAVAAPAIGGYMRDAAAVQARADVEAIGSALSRMMSDTGEPWVLRDANGTTATVPPVRSSGNLVHLLVSGGSTPTVRVARVSAGSDWNAAVANASGVQLLDNFLVLNTPSGLTDNRYRIATDMTIGFDPDTGGTFNSEFSWRGAYLPGPIGADPWGNRYAVNVEFLAKTLGAPAGHVNDVFVLSAGQNGTTDTRFDLDGASAGGDDVIVVVSGATR